MRRTLSGMVEKTRHHQSERTAGDGEAAAPVREVGSDRLSDISSLQVELCANDLASLLPFASVLMERGRGALVVGLIVLCAPAVAAFSAAEKVGGVRDSAAFAVPPSTGHRCPPTLLSICIIPASGLVCALALC